MKKWDAFRARASDLLGRPIDSASCESLERTDEVFKRFGDQRTEAERNCGSSAAACHELADEHLLAMCIVDMNAKAPSTSALLFLPESQWCGAVRTTIHEVLARAAEILRSKEDVLACTPDGSIGVFITSPSEYLQLDNGVPYRVVTWGFVMNR